MDSRRLVAAILASLLACGRESESDYLRSQRILSDLTALDQARRRKAYAVLCRFPVDTVRAEPVAAAARKAALDPGDPVRGMAFELLAHMHTREGPEFAAVLADPAEPIAIRMRAAEIVDPSRVTAEAVLATIVDDGGAPLPLRVQAARSLSSGCLSAAPALSRAMKDDDPSLREVAAVALAGLGDAAALKAALAPDGDPARRAPVAALGHLGRNPIWALPQLEASLGDPVLRPAAFRVLAGMGADGVPVLVAALRSPDADMRRGAAGALQVVRFAGKEAIGPLEEIASRDPDVAVRAVASSALREIGPSFAQLAAELDGAADETTRARAINAIAMPLLSGARADTVVVEPLRRMLRDPAPDVRREAIPVLGQIGAPSLGAVPEIVALLASDPAEGVRSVAALNLLPLYLATAAPDTRALIAGALERARQDPSKFVRQCADQSARGLRSGLQRPFQRCAASR